MFKKRYSVQVRQRVERLRKAGKTYAEIQTTYTIPKSTLSVWLGEKYPLFDKKTQAKHLAKIRLIAARTLRERRVERERLIIQRARKTLEALPLHDVTVCQALLAMLYWAEGAKTERSVLKFANTDPRLAQLYITLLRTCFSIVEEKLRVRVHIHHYHNKREVVTFWSKLLQVPESQFGKLYVKKRSIEKRFRRNSMGICFITYLDTTTRKELLELGYAIYGRVVKLKKPSSFNG